MLPTPKRDPTMLPLAGGDKPPTFCCAFADMLPDLVNAAALWGLRAGAGVVGGGCGLEGADAVPDNDGAAFCRGVLLPPPMRLGEEGALVMGDAGAGEKVRWEGEEEWRGRMTVEGWARSRAP